MKNKTIKRTVLACIGVASLALLANIFALQIIQPQAVAPPLSQDANPTSVVELQVNNESEDERKQAFIKTLDQVLTKNSDNPKITTLTTIKAALSNPSIYVQSYTYVTHAIAGTSANQQAMFLRVQFDQAAIKQLLQQTIKSEQKSDKQQTLVWLVKVAMPGNKIMEDESSNDIIVPILKKSAQDFGASIMFPMSDLQDTSSIKADDICNLNTATIKDASQRYRVRTIIAGCVKEPTTDNVWTSQWLLLRDGKSNTFNFSGSTIDSVIMQAMGAITLNATGAVKDHPKKLILRVTNVRGLDQYNEVVRYLTAYSQIAQIDLIKISPAEVELGVNTKGDKQALAAVLDAQKNKLVRNTDITPVGIDLDYKWVTVGNEQPQAIGTKPVP
ncbi:conserved exported hypothetical protein [Gammaproteobacteria bacterium]